MILANVINLPIVVVWGFWAFIPLTLLVTQVESVVLRWVCKVSVRQSFSTVFWANVLSTVAGWFVYGVQDTLLAVVGIHTFADFLRYYLWGATLLLIPIYYAKSVLIEGWVGVRRLIKKGVDVPRGKLWKGFVLANLASYVIVGPLFYFTTRPRLRDMELVGSPAEVVKCTDTVYFLSEEDDHLWRVRADGSGLEEVVPHPVADFMVSADENAFVYRVRDGGLNFYTRGKTPVSLTKEKADKWFWVRRADISGDARLVAHLRGREIRVFDANDGQVVVSLVVDETERFLKEDAVLAWDADRPNVLHCYGEDTGLAWRMSGGMADIVSPEPRKPVRSYRRMQRGLNFMIRGQKQGDLTLTCWPIMSSYVKVERGDETLVRLQDNSSTFGAAYRGPRDGTFLSEPGAVLCEGAGQIYVLNALSKRFAVLAAGHGYVIASSATPHTASVVKLDEDEDEDERW